MPALVEINIDRNDVPELECLRERQLIPSIRTISFKDNRRLNKKGDNMQLSKAEMHMYSSGFLNNPT